jgi:hypothetical protein
MRRQLRSVAIASATAVLLTTVPALAAEPFGITACSGVRPGAIIQAPKGTIYTMGFLFKGTDAKKRTAKYVMTVGDFVLPAFRTKVWPGRSGPQAYDARGKAIGRFVYAKHTDTPAFRAFGLVQLDKNIKPNAQVCHFGGPTDIYEAQDLAPSTVEFYGNGAPIDAVIPARTTIAESFVGQDYVYTLSPISIVDTGDKGAPFLVNGKALGFWDGAIGVGGGAGIAVARIGPLIALAEGALKLRLEIRTARRL